MSYRCKVIHVCVCVCNTCIRTPCYRTIHNIQLTWDLYVVAYLRCEFLRQQVHYMQQQLWIMFWRSLSINEEYQLHLKNEGVKMTIFYVYLNLKSNTVYTVQCALYNILYYTVIHHTWDIGLGSLNCLLALHHSAGAEWCWDIFRLDI